MLSATSFIGLVSTDSILSPTTGIVVVCLGFTHVFEIWAPFKTIQDIKAIRAYSLVNMFEAALVVMVDVISVDPLEHELFGAYLCGNRSLALWQ